MIAKLNENRPRPVFRGATLMFVMLVSVLALAAVFTLVLADSYTEDFETFTLGNVNGQDGWSKTGVYDVEIVDPNTFGINDFGDRSLRISNYEVSGSFGDHTFTKSLVDEAGETEAENGGMSGGTRQTRFEASWDFISTTPLTEQVGLAVAASPDRGDGARMSYVAMLDTSGGIDILFYEYQRGTAGVCDGTFDPIIVASGLDRSVVHNIRITMEFVDGADNDIVQVYVDNVLVYTAGSWEDYFRDCENLPVGNPPRTVDSILFRTGGTKGTHPAPDSQGLGFLIDNVTLTSSSAPPAPTGYYVTTENPGTVDSVNYSREDILFYDPVSDTWSLFFDGSAFGLSAAKHDINAIDVNSSDDLYLSLFQNKVMVDGLGRVFGHDIIHFDGSGFSFFFDGSDVGLTTVSEKLDSIAVLDGSYAPSEFSGACSQGYLLVSTFGTGKVPAFGGGQLKFQGEDILGFCMTNSGGATAGFWHMFLDGSVEGMPKNSTFGLSADLENDRIFLVTKNGFNVDSASGDHSMVYEYDLTSGEFSGPIVDFTGDLTEKVNGLHVLIFNPI